MSGDPDKDQEFKTPDNLEEAPPTWQQPDVARRGFYAPQYEAKSSTVEMVKEPSKGRKILGGLLSIVGGGVSVFFYVVFFFFLVILGIILLIFAQPALIFLLFMPLLGILGGTLAFVGGILGLTKATRTGAIISVIGNTLGIAITIALYFLTSDLIEVIGEEFLFLVLCLLPGSICGTIGAIILFFAVRTYYYSE